jgi:hypothetical protein
MLASCQLSVVSCGFDCRLKTENLGACLSPSLERFLDSLLVYFTRG